mgnify:FL=1
MSKRTDIKSVLVVGSGPIIIGQAAEFDYAGTQACRALTEEGIYTILVNSNPATIMTDTNIADKVYIEPLTPNVLKEIVRVEKPDGILPTLGGQTGLNLVMELEESGFLRQQGVALIGTTGETIKKAEDRQTFKDTMEKIGEPCIESCVVSGIEAALLFAEESGSPVIVRPAYTLGGTGGGIARCAAELETIAENGLRASRVHQILVERCIAGWKEIEYECLRDHAGNVITVCSMENFDPVGVHTGDSIVVAPVQTLADKEYQMLRSSALRIVEALGITGGCNVQFALDPDSAAYAVIEVNPRVSRSSALASKATGYPIAKVAAKIALGYCLNEIKNAVTQTTYASFEPALDYIAVKIPKWPFDKFMTAARTLGTQMKATGEVMAIAATFESGLMKAVRSLEQNLDSLDVPWAQLKEASNEAIEAMLDTIDDHRLFTIAEAFRRNISLERIHQITRIDRWFLQKIQNIVGMERSLTEAESDGLTQRLLSDAKYMGFTDKRIASYTGISEHEIRAMRGCCNMQPEFRMVDTCAAEFSAVTPYFYSAYQRCLSFQTRPEQLPENGGTCCDPQSKRVLVLGSGPIRIGQGIEFDYCSVHAVWALKKYGYETIIINNNPETVSTDFDIADRLYFEPLTPEDVRNVAEREKPCGAIVQFGGQTAIQLAEALVQMGVPILGTSVENINNAEDRACFDHMLEACGIRRPSGYLVFAPEEAVFAANSLGYPVLVRPSYVLGGQGMEIANTDSDILEYMSIITKVLQEHPILVDKYIEGKEVEVDAVCDGTDILIPGIMEHQERAGVHSGDSISVYPPQTISPQVKEKILTYTKALSCRLCVKGLINIQFIVQGEDVYIIEANPRSSRTVPYISKVTGLPIVEIAVRCVLGEKLRNMEYGIGLYPEAASIAVKMPVFSFEKITGADIALGPEMKSTGEVLGVAETYPEALRKAFEGAGIKIFGENRKQYAAISVRNRDKREVLPLAEELARLGYGLYATAGTWQVLRDHGISAELAPKLSPETENDRAAFVSVHGKNMIELIGEGRLSLVINTPTHGRRETSDGFKIRRAAVEHGIPCMTSLDTAAALLAAVRQAQPLHISAMQRPNTKK